MVFFFSFLYWCYYHTESLCLPYPGSFNKVLPDQVVVVAPTTLVLLIPPGKIGKIGKFGKIGKIGKICKIGKIVRIGKIGKIGKIW